MTTVSSEYRLKYHTTPVSSESRHNGGHPGHEASRGFEELQKLAGNTSRFPILYPEENTDRMMIDREKYLKAVTLKEFNPSSEKELEDWVDAASIEVAKYRLNPLLFQDLWSNVCRSNMKEVILRADTSAGFEGLVDNVAKKLFPVSRYVIDLEDELLFGLRHDSVWDAKQWLEKKVSRYLRLCSRHNRTYILSNERLRETVEKCFPDHVRRKLVLERFRGSVEEILNVAFEIEVALRRITPIDPEPFGAMAAMDELNEHFEAEVERSHLKRSCRGCGNVNHYYKDCYYRKSRCNICQKIGHIAKVCPNAVEKDKKGRVMARMEPKPGSLNIQFRKDRTVGDQITSAEEVLTKLKEAAELRSLKAKDRRKIAKAKSTKETSKRKRRRSDPVDVVDEEDDENSGLSEEELDDKLLDAIKSLDIGMATTREDTNVRIPCHIKEIEVIGVADTGAAKSLCGLNLAKILSLKPTSCIKSFRGLGGVQKAVESQEIELRIGNKRCKTSFFIVAKEDFPLLIGCDILKKLRLRVDAEENAVYCKDTQEFIAVSWEAKQIAEEKERNVPKNIVSGIDEGLSDVDLLKKYYDNTFMALTTHLTVDIRKQVWDMFVKYSKCWLRPQGGEVNVYKASFVVEGPPIKQQLRPMSLELRKELERQVMDMLKKNIIRPSKSPWGAPPVFVKKKTGEWRLCLDYRKINKRMKPDAYPLPLIWNNLQLAAHHQYYTCLDCNWGFWNIALDEKSKEYTAFISHMGCYEFNVLPFGIKNAPSECQRVVDIILGELYHKGVLSYIDDIVIYANNLKEHNELLEQVLKRCVDKGLYLKLQKSEILQKEVTLLGHKVGVNGIKPNPKKIHAIHTCRAPQNKSELKSFLGLASYVRRFVPHYSQLVSPLTYLTKKNVPFVWAGKEDNAFKQLKLIISEHVLLSAPSLENQPFIIVTDASDMGIGSALLQLIDKEEIRILEFASKTLTDAEKKWSIREREAYAIKWSIERFEDYVKGSQFYVITDHESLRWLEKASSGKVQRWALYLQQFDAVILHVDGKYNPIADWLSRSVATNEDALIDDIAIPIFTVELLNLIPTVSQLKTYYEEKSIPEEDLKFLMTKEDGLKYNARNDKLYIPIEWREGLMNWFHTGSYGGHCGINRTVRRISKYVWWPKIHNDVSKYITGCLFCQRKQTKVMEKPLINVLERPMPFQLISLDHVGPRNIGAGCSISYLVIIDHYSRFVIAIPVEEITALSTKELLRLRWIGIFGAPDCVLTDRGPAFRSKDFTEYVTDELGAYHVYTSPYYPQGNGINEACHQSLEAVLQSFAILNSDTTFKNRRELFIKALSYACLIHNATPHISLGFSPYEMLFGHEMILPGWQHFRPLEITSIEQKRMDIQQQALLKASLITQKVVMEEQNVIIGDFIIYKLSPYEKEVEQMTRTITNSYKLLWSIPHKVMDIKDNVIYCLPIGHGPRAVARQVPRRLVKKLSKQIPSSLLNITLEQLNFITPYRPWKRHFPEISNPSKWDDVERVIKEKKQREG